MSRISEAMRRAAEERNAGASEPVGATSQGVAEGPELDALAHEPFPVEMGEWRKARPQAPTESRSPEPEAPVAQPEPALVAPAGVKTLFERIDSRLAEKVVADTNMAPMWREQYRRLAAMLHDAQGNTGVRVIMVASAAPAEGKTLTATNLALTLSDSYLKRVLLIDADLRKPAIHHLFQLNTTAGLIDGLDAKDDVQVGLRQVSSQLWVLPAGRPTSDPMGGLTSDRMRRVLKEARETFDWVIIDTPPLLLLPDAHLLSSMIDGAVLVVRANFTPHDLVKRAVDIIGRSRITGVVLNRAVLPTQQAYASASEYERYDLSPPAGTARCV